MNIKSFLIYLQLLLLTSCGQDHSSLLSSSSSSSYVELPYSQRFEMIEFLAKNFPGVRSPQQQAKRGLWAGIYWQTKWQLETQRDQNPLWAYVNATLTIEPFYFAKDFLNQTTCENSSLFIEFPTVKTPTKIAVCQKWFRYFAASTQTSVITLDAMQAILWDVHTETITVAQKEHQVKFAQTKSTLPELEGYYWDGWINLVYTLDELNFSTLEQDVAYISRNMLAPCSPIGKRTCRIYQFPRLEQQILAYYLIWNVGDILDILSDFKR